MDFTIVVMTLAAAALAFGLISHSRTRAARRREAEFLARHLRPARRLDGPLHLLIWPPADQSRRT